MLEKPLKPPNNGASSAESLVYSTIAGALLREPAPFHEVWDRGEGKVKESTPSVLPGGQVLNIIVVGGGQNLQDIIQQVKERTKQLTMGES